ncbi:helix-turn-helix domain-containing protein [Bacillus spizizenii]|uniref:Helix-turn-helix domain-containing protein n=1 Tax=Bacillus spizizenii TaxID=96241 RepID=A0A9Q4DPK6_BACSC|nr:helix-turn-helix domain-containing protein [Bacillus spizizenii]MCY8155198.1 helix-turn-helix domain-containing protein [Bacillus spizizenii]MCY8313018.1 helix-turn-helix domain-containing protein [Bacillus spizizenii]MCY8416567.1 helix-turn-helix domain-containing protein [Bacillus spizizenii]MCY9333642.1 helix-turn-helix domain-containing protein [Bacillus spizizenii]
MSTKVSVSDEKQFIYRDSFNKGHIQTPSMVENCLNLSNDAKTVYSNILNHVYEKGHYAFPSTYKLAISSSCSVNSVVSYINELVSKGLIEKETRGRGRSNHYHVKDVHQVPLLIVSEMFWRSMSKLTHLYGWRKILPAKDKILKFMEENNYRLQDMSTDEDSEKQLIELLKHVLRGGDLEVGLLPRNMKYQKPTAKEEQTISSTAAEEENAQNSRKKRNVPVGDKKNHWGLMAVSDWGVEQFKEYYYDKYLDKTGHAHPRNIKKHTGMMRNVIRNTGGKELLKKYIDGVFDIGYDNLTLDYLSSNRIGEVQTYLLNGKKPFYIEKKEPKKRETESVLVQPTETLSSEEMLKKMLGGND